MATQDISNMSVTWNDAGTTFNGIKLSVTDTASHAGSLAMQINVDGSSILNFEATGYLEVFGDGAWFGAADFTKGLQLDGYSNGGFGLHISGGTLTGSGSALWIDQTWDNASATFYSLDLYATDTASNSASSFLHASLDSTQVFRVHKSGEVTATSILSMDPNNYNWFGDPDYFYGTMLALNSEGGGSIEVQGGVATVNNPMLNAVQTWNNAATTFNALGLNIVDSASSANSTLLSLAVSSQSKFAVRKDGTVSFGNSAGVGRADSAVVEINNGSSGYSGALQLNEMGAAPAAKANAVRLYTEDNGSGKTRLMAVFGTGSAVQLAIEP